MTTMSSRLTQEERMFMWGDTFLHVVSSIQFGLRKPYEDHKIFGFHEIFHTLNVIILLNCLFQEMYMNRF